MNKSLQSLRTITLLRVLSNNRLTELISYMYRRQGRAIHESKKSIASSRKITNRILIPTKKAL